MALATEVLLWLHIVAAAGLVGAAMVFGMIIGPSLPALTPVARGEFLVKVLPKYVRYAQILTVITPLIGVALAFSLPGGTASAFNPSTRFGMFISAGAGLSLVTLVVAFGVIGPASKKVVKLTEETMKNQGPSSPDLMAANNKVRIGAAVGLFILLAILVCMVAA
jgi:hypothetical protein